MGRELQKKKRRSGRQPVKSSNRTKKILNPRGNNVIAQNWDKKQTLSQNYRRLGLVARLKGPTGGTERNLSHPPPSSSSDRVFAVAPPLENAVVSEARVERDASGKIIRILRGPTSRRPNPLNDPLNDLSSDDDDEEQQQQQEEEEEEEEGAEGAAPGAAEWGGIRDDADDTTTATDVVKALVEESRNPAPKTARYQSEAETEWLQKLVARHGRDTSAMARDMKLNPFQQTARDIARRLKKMDKALRNCE
ncbi:Ribosome biogenesis protein Nop16 [Moelleriella libera RCEF 2490]|uniref:Nucleolar protein 16 n=1 Tax=Moelleriella libera RCEF 2490 TaxID=1081109 RepID=A0A168E2E7_9HYPO|nr:Ribosome biogenesis protein Nop16 [Moelleriella libera RCEF 2490]